MSRVSTEEELTFLIGEAAKILDVTVPWLRWRETQDWPFRRPDGTLIEPRRTEPKRSQYGRRRFTLQDLEDLNEAFYRNKIFTESKYKRVQRILQGYRKNTE